MTQSEATATEQPIADLRGDVAEDPGQPAHADPTSAESGRWGTVLAALTWSLYAAFSLLAVASTAVGGGMFLQTEILGESAPWQVEWEDDVVAQVPYVVDTIDFAAPLVLRTVESVRSGDFPEWSPYGQGGFELGGLPNSGAYSPLSLPWWVFPGVAAPVAVKLLELLVIGVGMSLFLRRLGLPQATWPVASLVFAASGFMVAWTNWPQTRVAAFIPLLFWAVDRSVSLGRIRDAVPVGLVFASMALGGFPAIMFYAGYTVAAWGIFRAVQLHRHRPSRGLLGLVVCGAGAALGVLLAAWQLMPFVVNARSVIDFSIRNYGGVHMPLETLGSMIYPNIAGGPAGIGSWSANPVEGLSYVGVAVLVLVSVLPLARSRFPGQAGAVGFFGVGAVFLIAALYFGGPALDLLQQLPTMSSSFIGRMRVVVGFFVAVLAAYGLAVLMQGRRGFVWPVTPRAAASWLVRGSVSVLIVVAAAAFCLRSWEVVPWAARTLLRPEILAITGIGAAAGVAALLGLVSTAPWLRFVAVSMVVLLVFAPALWLARLWWPPSPADTFYPATETHEFLAANLGDQRFEAVGKSMQPGTNQVYQLRSLGGRGFATVEWRELLQSIDPAYFASPTISRLTPPAVDTGQGSALLDRLAVRYLVQDVAQPPFGTRDEPAPAQGFGNVVQGASFSTDRSAGPLRGATFRTDPEGPSLDGVGVTAIVVADSGAELARTTTWYRSILGDFTVPIPGEAIEPSQGWRLNVTLSGDGAAAALQTTASEAAWTSIIRPRDDGLRIVHTGDATIYERQGSLPRVRWANSAVVEPDPQQRLQLLSSGQVAPDALVLERESDARPTTAGSAAEIISLASADADTVRYEVTATGDGWLLVEDSFRRSGWAATVDGVESAITPADHAAGAVYVPAGNHVVELQYRTPALRAGAGVSAAAVVLVLLGAAGAWGRNRYRRSRGGSGPSASQRPEAPPA